MGYVIKVLEPIESREFGNLGDMTFDFAYILVHRVVYSPSANRFVEFSNRTNTSRTALIGSPVCRDPGARFLKLDVAISILKCGAAPRRRIYADV